LSDADWDLPIGGLVDDGAVLAVLEERGDLDALRGGWATRLAYEQQLAEIHRERRTASASPARWPSACACCAATASCCCRCRSTPTARPANGPR
jgi:hypothetical protein